MLGYQAVEQLSALLQQLKDQLHELQKLQQSCVDDDAGLRTEKAALCLELAAQYLPILDQQTMMSAEKRTGFRAFSRNDPLKAMGKERTQLRKELERLRQVPLYVEREQRAGSAGIYTLKLAEAQQMLEPWEAECRRFEELDGFLELLEIGYDTPAFSERWWQPDYWRHWAAGDRICDRLGLADFGDDVLPAWEKVRAPREQWRKEVAAWTEKKNQVHDIVRKHDEVSYRMDNLERLYLEECQKRLAEHLTKADVGLLKGWAGEDRGLEMALLRLSAITAKQAYFQDVLRNGLPPLIRDLEERQAALLQKLAKLRRPKKLDIDVGNPAGSLRDKLSSIDKRRQKLLNANQRVRRFDDYGGWQATSTEAWWGAFFAGATAPIWAPGVYAWSQQHSQPERILSAAADPIPDFSAAGDIS
jgi:hypothetical protein